MMARADLATVEKLPRVGSGFTSRMRVPVAILVRAISASAWSDGRATVISTLITAEAPDGSGDVIPQWHLSVTEQGRRPHERTVQRVRRAFGLEAAEIDNHHPGEALHLFLVVDPARRVSCECKTTETVQREPDGYTWTNPTDEPCRGCEFERLTGKPCPIHAGAQ